MTQNRLVDVQLSEDKGTLWFIFQGPDGGRHRMPAKADCLDQVVGILQQFRIARSTASGSREAALADGRETSLAPIRHHASYGFGRVQMSSRTQIVLAFDPGDPGEIAFAFSPEEARGLADDLRNECAAVERTPPNQSTH